MNARTRLSIVMWIVCAVALLAPVQAASSTNTDVTGFSMETFIEPDETRTFSFPNNLHFSIESNTSMNLSIVYLPVMSNKQTSVQVFNQEPLSLEFKFRPTIKDFLPNATELPRVDRYKTLDTYGAAFELVSNVSVDGVTIQLEKLSTFGLEPGKNYTFAVYESAAGKWNLVNTIERAGTPTSQATLEASIHDLEAGESYYVTVFEVSPATLIDDHWIIVLVVLIVVILAASVVISKKDYVHMLKTRYGSITPGAHKMSLEEVLENENRNTIIDLILEEPGIHFNELLRRTELAPGNLVWHLDVLESYKVIGKKRVANRVVYFPYHGKNPVSNLDLQVNKSKLALEILKLVEDEPGTWTNMITKKLEVNRKTIQYHVDKLEELGVIRFEKAGKKKRIFINLDSEYFKDA